MSKIILVTTLFLIMRDLSAITSSEFPSFLDTKMEYGCEVASIPQPQAGKLWKFRAWASLGENKWARTITMRETRRKALLDCDAWQTKMEKKVAALNAKHPSSQTALR